MIRGAVAGKAGGRGGFKAGLREMTPVEIRRAIDDSVKTPHIFMADQKYRKAAEAARGREEAVDLIPQSDLETYRLFQNDRGNRAGSSVITPKQNADGTLVAAPDGAPVQMQNSATGKPFETKEEAGKILAGSELAQYFEVVEHPDGGFIVQSKPGHRIVPVSYTHLTLPTNREV